jgi:hypothetical protein
MDKSTEWDQYRLMVLKEIENLNKKSDELTRVILSETREIVNRIEKHEQSMISHVATIEDKMSALDKRVTVIETKSLILGGMSGFAVALLPKVLELIQSLIK